MANKPGPKGPSKPLTDDKFHTLVSMIRMQCTQEEICDALSMTHKTLNKRLKDRGESNFSHLYKKHSMEGRASLRRAQWKSAQEGSVPMQIFLGKNYLGQTDKKETEITGHVTVNITGKTANL